MRRTMLFLSPLLLAACMPGGSGVVPFRHRDPIVIDGRTYQKFEVSELGPCITIDDGNDSALAAARTFLTNGLGHQSIETARTNLNGCGDISSVDLTVVGHGGEGSIFVGGAGKRQTGKFVGSENEAEWKPLLKDLASGSGVVSLLACNTGSGKRGAKLLNKLTKTTKRPVRALTGIAYIFTDAIHLEAGIDWNVATPEQDAGVVNRPKPANAPFPVPANLNIGNKSFSLDSIARVRIDGWEIERETAFSPTAEERRDLAQLIDFTHPFTPPGLPLAPVTARIVIELSSGPGLVLRDEVTLLIYGDVLAQDAADPSRFFDIDPGANEGGLEAWAARR